MKKCANELKRAFSKEEVQIGKKTHQEMVCRSFKPRFPK
jgi:hypothetical protein